MKIGKKDANFIVDELNQLLKGTARSEFTELRSLRNKLKRKVTPRKVNNKAKLRQEQLDEPKRYWTHFSVTKSSEGGMTNDSIKNCLESLNIYNVKFSSSPYVGERCVSVFVKGKREEEAVKKKLWG